MGKSQTQAFDKSIFMSYNVFIIKEVIGVQVSLPSLYKSHPTLATTLVNVGLYFVSDLRLFILADIAQG
jgi:hypothetical protein